jgi:hypothetical protein
MPSTSYPVMNPGAMGLYNQQLQLNLSNYANIANAYNQAQANAGSQLGGIYKGYGSLTQSVLGALGVQKPGDWGVATPAAQQIERQYQQSQGQNQQALINAGLGNSSTLSNVMNQGSLQAAQAYGNLGAQLAQTAAGYESQIGLAGLSARQQGLSQQLGLTSNYMGNIAHFDFAPRIDPYGQYSYSAGGGGGGGGGGGAGAGTMSGGSPFSNWLMNSGVPAYSGTAANSYGYSPGYSQGGYGGQPAGRSFGGYGNYEQGIGDFQFTGPPSPIPGMDYMGGAGSEFGGGGDYS